MQTFLSMGPFAHRKGSSWQKTSFTKSIIIQILRLKAWKMTSKDIISPFERNGFFIWTNSWWDLLKILSVHFHIFTIISCSVEIGPVLLRNSFDSFKSFQCTTIFSILLLSPLGKNAWSFVCSHLNSDVWCWVWLKLARLPWRREF